MVWAQFYHLRDGSYVEAVGSDQVYIMDGRWSRHSMEVEAHHVARMSGYDGWRLYHGERFTQGFALTAAVRPTFTPKQREVAEGLAKHLLAKRALTNS